MHSAYQQAQQRNYPATNGNRNQETRNQPHRTSSNHSGSWDGNRSGDGKGFQEDTHNTRNRSSAERRFPQNLHKPLRQPAKIPTEEPAIIKPETRPLATKAVAETKPMATDIDVETKTPVNSTVGPVSSDIVLLASVTPRKPLVPSSCIIQKLPVGATFVANVVELATASASKQNGFVCLTINEDYSDVYGQLCEEFSTQCQKDKDEYIPRIGETFAYFCEDDEGWYRARCLSSTRGALLDAGRVVPLAQRHCRKLPSAYTGVPEFIAVLKMDGLQVGANVNCAVIATSPVKVTVTDEEGGALGEADAARWAPVVDYPQESEEAQTKSTDSKPVETAKKVQEPIKTVPEPAKMVSEPVKKMQEPEKPLVKRVEPAVVTKPQPVTRKPLVPDSFVVGKLGADKVFLAEVVCYDSAEQGFVCVTVHGDYSEPYTRICEDFSLRCLEDTAQYTPSIGETFAYLNQEDEGWYRARCLARTRGALLDSGHVVSLEPSACRKLPSGYDDVPEFVAVIKTDKLEVGANLSCVVISTGPRIVVRVTDEDGTKGEYQIKRWTPLVEYPSEPVEKNILTAATPVIASLERPFLEHNALYYLCDVTSLSRACVRPADSNSEVIFHAAVHDTATYGLTAKPLTEPAQKGETVVAKFEEDGMFYRAFVKRVSVPKNKYLIEYLEYGNEEIVPLERLYPCPSKLSVTECPPQASLVRLSERDAALSRPARAYVDRLKEGAALVVTIPGGEKCAASGSLVNLLVAKTCEQASRKVEELCTPPWRMLMERGGDVMETESRLYSDVKYTPLPSGPVTLSIPYCDANALASGSLSAHRKGDEAADRIFGELTEQIQEYAESPLCKEPYLPKLEELCIVKNRRDNKWARAVLANLPNGAGSQEADVVYIDYGNIELVPTSLIRKMMPEFVDEYPCVTHHLEIKDFPKGPVSQAQLERAMLYLRVGPRGGELEARALRELDDNMYEVDAGGLLATLAD